MNYNLPELSEIWKVVKKVIYNTSNAEIRLEAGEAGRIKLIAINCDNANLDYFEALAKILRDQKEGYFEKDEYIINFETHTDEKEE